MTADTTVVTAAPPPPATGTAALLRLAGPMLIAQLAVMGLAVIDTVMAGRLSAQDLAAVAIGASVYASVYVGFMGVLSALTPIAGHHYGAGRYHDIGIDLGQALWLSLFLALLGMPLLVFNGPWLALAGAEPQVADIAQHYLYAIAFGLPAALGTRTFVALNSAVSRPQVTMLIQLVALAVKVPLNLVFMYGAGPIPAFGGAGCGVATAVISWMTLLLSFAVWRLDPYFVRFRSRQRHGPLWSRQRELLKLGLPSGGSLLIEVTSFTFIALLVARLGAVTTGGHQIVANLVSVMFMLPLALGVASSVLVSQCLGAQSPKLARHAALRGFRLTFVVAVLLSALLLWQREAIIGAYTTDAAVAQVAMSLALLAAAFHVFDAVQGMAGFVLRGYKVALLPMVVHGSALWGVGLGGGYLLAYHSDFGTSYGGATAFWAAGVAGLVIAAVVLSTLLLHVSRRAMQPQTKH